MYTAAAAVLCGRKARKADQLTVVLCVFKSLCKHDQHRCCPFTDSFDAAYVFQLIWLPLLKQQLQFLFQLFDFLLG